MGRGVPVGFRAFVIQFEGEKMDVYPDIRGIPTIYIGHKCLPHETYLHTILDSAQYLAHDSQLAFDTVERLTHGEANDNEYMAMGDLTFNEGVGAFATSTVLKEFLKGNKQAAADAFLLFDKVTEHGVLVYSEPLHRRRLAERELFLKAVSNVSGNAK